MNNPFKALRNAIFGKGQIPQKMPNLADDIAYKFQRLKDYNTVNDVPQIEHFINAYNSAVDTYSPSRWELMDIYQNIHNRDPHLKAKIRERVARIKNRIFRVTDSKNLELPITQLFRKKWFSDFLYHSMMAKFYGYSLIEFSPSSKPFEFFVSNFDRRQIVIDSSAIVKTYVSADYSSLWRGTATEKPNELYFYKENKDLQKYFFEVRFDNDDLGLLEIIACLCILKRHSWGSWDEFERLFGVPMRIGKTPTRDQKTLNNIADWLDRMGNAAWAVFTQDTEIQVIQPNNTDAYNVFEKKIDKVDAQISKLIIGSTLTSDTAANGNRSLGDIHSKTADEILQEDIIDMENLVNGQLLPFLKVFWKFPMKEGAKFEFYEKRSFTIDERVKIDDMLLKNGFALDAEWIQETYDVKLVKNTVPTIATTNTPLIDAKKKVKPVNEAKNFLHDLHKFYDTDCPCCVDNQKNITQHGNFEPMADGIDDSFENLLKAIFEGKIIDNAILIPLAESYFSVLVQAIDKNFDVINNTPFETEMQTALRNNTSVFAAAKSIDEQKSLASLLVGSDGLAKSFEEFKNEALQIHSYYKGSWLQAEYNYALRSVQTAKQWLQIESQKEIYPNLRYQTVGDELVRESHKLLDNVTLPVNHPFWKTHKPPLDWNCRCYLEQVSLSEEDLKITENDKIPYIKIPEQFKNNPAISKLIYNDAMPYFARANPIDMKQSEIVSDGITRLQD